MAVFIEAHSCCCAVLGVENTTDPMDSRGECAVRSSLDGDLDLEGEGIELGPDWQRFVEENPRWPQCNTPSLLQPFFGLFEVENEVSRIEKHN
jgi:hypothetical protein